MDFLRSRLSMRSTCLFLLGSFLVLPISRSQEIAPPVQNYTEVSQVIDQIVRAQIDSIACDCENGILTFNIKGKLLTYKPGARIPTLSPEEKSQQRGFRVLHCLSIQQSLESANAILITKSSSDSNEIVSLSVITTPRRP